MAITINLFGEIQVAYFIYVNESLMDIKPESFDDIAHRST